MIKAIFFDIDGTLVSFNTHKISYSSKKAIQKLKEKGIKVQTEADETTKGPEHFTIQDPDGNQILVDQHR